MRLVDELIERQLLRMGDPLPRGGRGKPSPAIEIAPDFAYTVGVSIGTDSVSTALIDMGGKVLQQTYVAVRDFDANGLVTLLRKQINDYVRKYKLREERLFGVGVGITGFFVGDGARVNPPLPLERLALIDLETLLTRELALPVWLDNDGTVAAVGESLLGAGRWAANFVYLYFSHGLGGGVVVDGRVVRGSHGNAGEVAAMLPMQKLERPTLEQLRSMLEDDGIAFPDIGEMLASFDPNWLACDRWTRQARRALSLIASAAAALIDPDAIVFGGRIPYPLAQRLIDEITIDNLARRGRGRPEPRLVPAEAPSDTAAIGAALLPFKECLFG
ncbi:putative NBD/HSP70 family sugar kinase [Paraburkholderia caledonica]|uniref:NBD/HSP70 family sugar kinase n=2 Tax=Paraburkholderia caledonica TaxID=134536 RepID=A0AB73INJ2_9BURK|nr:putative NBD/HSP70 family sugar kinase [Paraburkholderia caledonica]